jgi:hypothetical protein
VGAGGIKREKKRKKKQNNLGQVRNERERERKEPPRGVWKKLRDSYPLGLFFLSSFFSVSFLTLSQAPSVFS